MIRYLENNEKQNIRPLYEHCFNDTTEYTDYYFEKSLPQNHIAVNEQDNKIVSAVHLISKTVIVGKLKTNIMYLYGIGTDANYRNRGLMNETVGQVVKDLFNEMEAFTYLIPADAEVAPIYRKLGFEYVMDKPKMKQTEQIKKPLHSLISRKAENADLVRLAIFAKSATEKKYCVTLSKDIEYFRKIMELIEVEGGHINIYVENKVIVGYRIWLDDEILEEVLDPSISTMSWCENQGNPYVMARVLNIRKTLRLLGFKGFGQKIIKLSDPVIEENNGCFKLSYDHGNVKLDKIDESILKEEPEFDITIAELTAHIFGYNIIEGLPKVCKKGCFFVNDYL